MGALSADFVGCTVATRRFVAQARVVAESFLEHHPGGRFAVLVPDDPRRERTVDPRVIELRPADVGVDERELHRIALAYTAKDLACAMKVHLLRHFAERGETAVLLDGDMCVYGDLAPAAAAAREAEVVLSVHARTPHGTPDRYPPKPDLAPRMRNAYGPEQMMVQSGGFNGGLFAAGPRGMPFLDWWRDRIARYCLQEPNRGLFHEQGWTALAPALFDCRILREPGWNVSGFQLHDADVAWDGGRPTIAGAPLRCFHFMTFDPRRADELSSLDVVAALWPRASQRPGAARLHAGYARRLLGAGHEAALEDVSPYDRLPDGTAVDENMRAAYAEALLRHEAGQGPAPPNPFDDGDAEGWLRWLAAPAEGSSQARPVSRYLLALHTRMQWVYGAFREVPGRDAGAYLDWLPAAARAGHVDVPERWLPPHDPPAPPPPDPALASLQEEYRDLLRTVESYRTSRSWRMTAPLRRLGGLMRR